MELQCIRASRTGIPDCYQRCSYYYFQDVASLENVNLLEILQWISYFLSKTADGRPLQENPQFIHWPSFVISRLRTINVWWGIVSFRGKLGLPTNLKNHLEGLLYKKVLLHNTTRMG